MNDLKFLESPLFLDQLYDENFKVMNGIKFTRGEISVIACLLNARGTSKIASLLKLSTRTVSNRIYDIMRKLECHSRDTIIDFMEKNNKSHYLRYYYSNLLIDIEFKKLILENKINLHKNTLIKIYFWEKDNNCYFYNFLIHHFKLINIYLEYEIVEDNINFEKIFNNINNDNLFTIYLVNKENFINLYHHFQKMNDISLNLKEREYICIYDMISFSSLSIDKKNNFINLKDINNIYYIFISILDRIFPALNLPNNFLKSNQFYGTKHIDSKRILLKDDRPLKKENLKNINFFSLKTKLLENIKIILFLFLGLIYLIFYMLSQKNITIHSDLDILSHSELLPRSEINKEIHNFFKNHSKDIQTIALMGPGGAGKTTLANQYGHQQTNKIIWFINAETKESLINSLEALCVRLTVSQQDKIELKEMLKEKNIRNKGKKILELTKNHLKKNPDWLLIYDNVEKFSDIKNFYPKDSKTWGQGQIIITTQDFNIQNNKYINHAIQIKELSSKEKFYLFNKIINKNFSTHHIKINEVNKFLENIPSFPLDVSIAAYYIKTTGITYQDYINNLSLSPKKLSVTQENILKDLGHYNKTRYKIISFTLKEIIETHPDFKNLLLFISLINSQNVPKSIFFFYVDKLTVDNFIINLKKYSLISDQILSHSEESFFSIHRSTQKVILSYLKNELRVYKKNPDIDKIIFSIEKYSDIHINSENTENLKIIKEHIISILKNKNLFDSYQIGTLYHLLGSIFYQFSDFFSAEKYFQKSIENLNKNNVRLALVYESLGCLYSELGKYKESIKLRSRSLSIFNKFNEKYYNEKTKIFSNLGYVYKEVGKYKKAEQIFQNCLSLYKKKPPKTYVDYAWLLLYLGYLYEDLNELEKSKKYYDDCINLCNKHLKSNHIVKAWALSSLGNIYRKLKNFKKAKELIKDAIKICKDHSFNNHVGYAFVINHLGCVFRDEKNYYQSRSLLEKSLSIYNRCYKKDHVRIALTLRDLAKLKLAENYQHEGLVLLEKSLELMQKNKHPNLYIILEDLGDFYLNNAQTNLRKNKYRYEELKKISYSYYKKCYEILLKYFSKDSSHILRLNLKIKKSSVI